MAAEFDRDLDDLPPALRWREWMVRAEAVLFASAAPVTREMLARVVGRDCSIDLLIDDIAAGAEGRPWEIARTAGGWQIRTRAKFAGVIRAAAAVEDTSRPLSRGEALVLTAIAYLQPVTRAEVSRLVGREISRDTVARLSRAGLIARGPRSPEPGAPYTYVTARGFLEHFGLDSLRDLPDLEALEDAGLLTPGLSALPDLPLAGEDEG